MFVYAFREMMLGMKVKMTENKILLDPQIPESILNVCMPMKFEHRISTKEGSGQLEVTIEPDKKKIAANIKSNNFRLRPEFVSNSYSIA